MEKKFYFREAQIEEILRCDVCKMKMYEPKLLPCGESICGKCAVKQTDSTTYEMNCSFCQDVHYSPKTGFPPNKRLTKLAELIPVCKPKTRTERLLRAYVKDVKSKTENLVKNVQQSSEMMKLHVTNIKNDFEKAADTAVDAINKTHDDLFHK
jgi:hypothetical protein